MSLPSVRRRRSHARAPPGTPQFHDGEPQLPHATQWLPHADGLRGRPPRDAPRWHTSVLRQTTDVELGIGLSIVGVIVTVLLGVPPVWLEVKHQRSHVRLVSARVEPTWRPVDNDLSHRVLTGGRFTVVNAGPLPVWDVSVSHPNGLDAAYARRLGPGERYELDLPEAFLRNLDDGDMYVSLALCDAHRRNWLWTPEFDQLERAQPRITPLARLVQWSSRRWPEAWHDRFVRLPKPVLRVLWGYDPEGLQES